MEDRQTYILDEWCKRSNCIEIISILHDRTSSLYLHPNGKHRLSTSTSDQHSTSHITSKERTSEERAEHGDLSTLFIRQSSLFVFLLQDGRRLLSDICTSRVDRG